MLKPRRHDKLAGISLIVLLVIFAAMAAYDIKTGEISAFQQRVMREGH